MSSLQGLRVIEIGTSVAAPMAGQILGDLGADVIKIERRDTGDDSRNWAPPHWGGESVTFLALNRNKRSVVLDYKDERGRKVLEDLIAGADVLIANLRPGALAKAGFSPERCADLNPRLIYCELSGFGRTGPRADQPAYDPLLQAFGGIVSITGQGDGAPSRVPVSLLDMGTGMWTVIAVYEALRRRDVSGTGTHVELSLLQTALTWVSIPLTSVLAGNPAPARLGSGLAGVVPYGAYPTKDGWVFISAGNDTLWAKLCRATDAPHLQAADGFGSNGERVRNRELVDAALGAVTARFETGDLLARLNAEKVPCAPVQTLDEVAADEQVAAIGAITPLEHPLVDGFRAINLPVTFDGDYAPLRSAPPPLGSGTREVLEALGLPADEIEALAADGVVQFGTAEVTA
jgi:crotonobetainyl-CoA:carnitine CoA-transferase CaiB-like acyl-CoA transferase